MATLPDLDTSDVGLAGYYKLNDSSGEDGIDPGSATSLGSLQNYTLYDNGWIGEVNNGPYTNMKVRVKSDGWVVVYVPSNAGWTSRLAQFGEANNSNGIDNNIGDTISNIASELNNSPSFAAGNETWYDFEYGDAVRIGRWRKKFKSTYSAKETKSYEFEINGNVFWGAITGYRSDDNATYSIPGDNPTDITTLDLSDTYEITFSSEYSEPATVEIVVMWGPES